MSSISTLRKFVESEAPECPGPTIDRALRKTARDLCNKTYCWKEARTNVDLTTGVSEYTLTLLAGADLVGVEYVQFNGANGPHLWPATERDLDAGLESSWRTAVGDPTHFFLNILTGKIRVYPIPNRTVVNGLGYEVYLKPAVDGNDLPEFLLDQYTEILQNGALYELLKMNGKKWSNPALAGEYWRMYRNGVYEARGKQQTMFATQQHGLTGTLVA